MTLEEEVSNRILTAPNVISIIRLTLITLYIGMLLDGNNFSATAVFAIAAASDFIDGQIARRTHQVSKLGQVLDPIVDRALLISAVIMLLILGRLPLWVPILVIARDAFLLTGGGFLLSRFSIRIPVVFIGKVATTLLYIGFVLLLLNAPLIPGLHMLSSPAFPGLSYDAPLGIWFVYIGLLLSMGVTVYYFIQGLCALVAALRGAHE